MPNKPKKRFFLNHAKSSAMVVSLGIHAVLIVVAISFVAVTVVKKAHNQFDASIVTRPSLPSKKLQVPVKMKKKRPKPKLRKQISVKTRMDRKIPEIKLPEIKGIKEGLGSADDNLGGVGFSVPEVDVFGVKSKGEKVFLILDSREFIMYDEVGGIIGYTLIKDELVRIIDSLPPTTLFNIAVFDSKKRVVLFKNMVPASQANVDKIRKWLEPLNKVSKGMAADDFGPKTLAKGGHPITEDFRTGKIQKDKGCYPPIAEAMKQQADTIFLLTSTYEGNDGGERIPMSKMEERKWEESYQKALKLLDKENKERLAKGEAPRAINKKNKKDMNKVYFPDIVFPSRTEEYLYTLIDFQNAFNTIRKKYAPSAGQMTSGMKKNSEFLLNIIQFIPEKDAGEFQGRYKRSIPVYQSLAKHFNGQYRMVKGMAEIKQSSGK